MSITASLKSEHAGISLDFDTTARGRAKYALERNYGLVCTRDIPNGCKRGEYLRILKVQDDVTIGCRVVTFDTGLRSKKFTLPSVKLAKYMMLTSC